MRVRPPIIIPFAIVIAIGLLTHPGRAQTEPALSGTYQVSFEPVADNCRDNSMTLGDATVTLKQRGNDLAVSLPEVPVMKGKIVKSGSKFKARARGPVPNTKLHGRFSIAGKRTEAGSIQLMFIAEFYSDKKPLCTQSFRGTGSRK